MYIMSIKNADLVFAGPDQRSYYNAVQLALPLSTMIRVPHSDMLFSFQDAVKELISVALLNRSIQITRIVTPEECSSKFFCLLT